MVTSNMLVPVPEVLGRNNYEEWSFCMRNYLIAEDLFDVVEVSSVSYNEEDDARWKRKNAKILHVLQISCAPEIFLEIKGINSAKDAWCKLAEMNELKQKWKLLGSGLDSLEGSDLSDVIQWFQGIIPGTTDCIERTDCLSFLEAVFNKEDSDTMMEFLNEHPPAIRARFFRKGFPILMSAVSLDNLNKVEQLVELMLPQDLEIKDREENTVLSCVAVMCSREEIASTIIKKNPLLLTIPDKNGMIPVVKACYHSNEKMTKFLYSETLSQDPMDGFHGSLLLHYCIERQMLDVALDLLDRHPRLAFTKNNHDSTPILTLTSQPSLFRSGCQLHFWKWWIYSSIKAKPVELSRNVHVSVTDCRDEQNTFQDQVRQPCGWSSIVPDILGNIYKKKMIHGYAFTILKLVSKELRTLNAKQVVESGIIPALFQATRNGIVEFVHVWMSNPDIMASADENLRDLFMHAIENRQNKFLTLDDITSPSAKQYLVSFRDKDKNNMLHLVAKLAPNSWLDRIPGPALKIQRELQWFKEIESIVPELKQVTNRSGETPRQMFSREHENLVREGEQWMKQAAESYTVVGALIITIMFAATFTVPGGLHQDSGIPIFLHKNIFTVFMLANGVALAGSSTSVLMFLGILTSRYTEDDFLKALPTKLIIGILALLISVTAMMTAFCASVSLILPGKLWLVILLIVVASIPVVAFMFLQSRLLIGILHSTFGPKILVKGKKTQAIWNCARRVKKMMKSKLCA